jgi:hypothetical protein
MSDVQNPAPKPNDSTPIWDLIIADMRARDAEGRALYGTPLQANNGRDALLDAYEEALDLCVYLRQAIEERHTLKSTLRERYEVTLAYGQPSKVITIPPEVPFARRKEFDAL